MNTALTIAGSDSSGGAGIQADLKTMTANGVFGMSAITSITAQNTQGVNGVYDVSPECLAAQLDAVFTDIFPDSVKIGMVSSVRLIEVIAAALEKYNPKNVVIDPVMVSTSGHRLLSADAEQALQEILLPYANIITPNIAEAMVLCRTDIANEKEMPSAARRLSEMYNTAILLKGGHMKGNDYLLHNGKKKWIFGQYINNPNTHGTGCTLSSAIASNLAKGYNIPDSVMRAKEYINGAIRSGLDLGKGRGPINHMWNLKEDKNGI